MKRKVLRVLAALTVLGVSIFFGILMDCLDICLPIGGMISVCILICGVRATMEALADNSQTNAYSNAALYNTDTGTGAVITELEKLNGQTVNYGDAAANAVLYGTDVAQGAVIAAIEELNKSKGG